jgi:hypothetical protein
MSGEIDPKFHFPMGQELNISIHFGSDHVHDKVTRRSISRAIVMVEVTPIIYMSKRQSTVQTSTNGVEFSAMRQATEEAVTILYIFIALGIHGGSVPGDLGKGFLLVQGADLGLDSISVKSGPRKMWTN